MSSKHDCFARGFRAVIVCVSVAATLGWIGCSDAGNGRNTNGHLQTTPAPSSAVRTGDTPIAIVCTTQMVADIVRAAGGAQVSVEALMGEGVDPHLYSPTPKDQQRLSKADMLFYNGLHLEAGLVKVMESLARRGKPVYAVTQDLEAADDPRLIKVDAGTHDPHVWNDPEIWAAGIETVRAALCRFDEKNKDSYTANCKKYTAEVLGLIAYGDKQFGKIAPENRVLVTAHDAFGYLAARYNFEVLPIQGVSTEAEASVGKIDELVNIIVNRKIKAVFTESSVNSQYLKALIEGCAARDHQVTLGGTLYSDAMGGPGSGADTYLTMFRANIDTITKALK
jgi:manganese/zinc/iron transport system substrate-binding protein